MRLEVPLNELKRELLHKLLRLPILNKERVESLHREETGENEENLHRTKRSN